MSKPVKHHYIPRSYLKNFADCKSKESCYVDVYFLKDDILRQNINTKTICYQKHLYTLQNTVEEKKYDLELYYANNVDSEFQKVYKLLIDKNKKVLTKDEKLKVLYVCLSLYFRTPIHLNHMDAFTDQTFDRLKLYANKDGFVKTTMFGGDKIHLNDLEKERALSKKRNKTNFHTDHMERWVEFVQHKYECTININEIHDKDSYLITCDNPVVIRESRTNKFNGLFNPNNVITLPLDTKHFLEIHPNTVAKDELEIQRLSHDRDYVFTTNAITHQNANKLLIGKKNTIDYHFKIQEHYEKPENGEKFIQKAQDKLSYMRELLRVTETYGANSMKVVEQLKKMNKNPIFKDDKQVEELIKTYKNLKMW